VNAAISAANNITFRRASCKPPFYDKLADDAMNFGGIGAVVRTT